MNDKLLLPIKGKKDDNGQTFILINIDDILSISESEENKKEKTCFLVYMDRCCNPEWPQSAFETISVPMYQMVSWIKKAINNYE